MNYSKRFLKTKPKPKPLRTIEEYIKAKKRFSSANFTMNDKQQIESTTEGFIIINNCKLPIKNGVLDLRIWINKHEKTTVPLTEDQKKEHKKAAQKAWRIRQKAKLLNPVEEKELSHDITSLNMPNIFRDYKTDKQKTSICSKRLITAKRNTDNPKTHYQQNRAKFGANIPIQHLLKTAQWLIEIGKEKSNKLINKKKNARDETWKEFYVKSIMSKKLLYPYLDIVQKLKDAQKPKV